MKFGILVDIALVLIIVIVLLIGLKRGFLKMLSGFLASVLAIVITVVLVSPLTGIVIKETQLDETLTQKIETPIAKNIPNSGAEVFYYDLNKDGVPIICVDLGNGPESFDNVFKGTPYATFSKVLEPIFKKQLDAPEIDRVVFIDVLTSTVVALIITICLFIVLWIVSKILLTIVMAIAKKLVDKTYIFHFADKLLGCLMGTVMGVLVIFIIFTVIQFMQNMAFMNQFMAILNESYFGKFILNNNILYEFINGIDIKSIIGKIGKK